MNVYADLLVRRGGRSVVVVEAKAREIPSEYLDVVRDQAARYARATGSQWSIIADPKVVRIFLDPSEETVAELPTESILHAAGMSRHDPIGEGLIILALRRWLEELASGAEVTQPELIPMAEAIRHADEFVADAAVA